MLAFLLGAQPLSAQGQWIVRGNFNVGIQTETGALAQSFTRTKNLETAPITAALPAVSVPFIDYGGTVRIVDNLGAGVSFSSLSRTDDADVTASIPHPFFFNQPRAIAGVAAVEQKEFATHLSVVYVVPSPSIDLALSAGLSFFKVEKDFVDDVNYTETYPYDTAAFGQAVLRHEERSERGYHFAADAIFKFSQHVGAGGLVRYSKATVPFTAGSLEVGGLQLGGGLRVLF
jgi:hypothetical protein